MSTAGSGSTPQTRSESSSPRDDWRPILNPEERRRIQNRIAQRKHRGKRKVQREEEIKREYDERMAGAAYSPPDPMHMGREQESGLPWGSFPLRHIVQLGRAREKQEHEYRLKQRQQPMATPYQQQIQQRIPHNQHQHHQQQQQQYNHYDQTSQHYQFYQHQHEHHYVPSPVPRGGASSSIGLHLANDYARGPPAWFAWRSQVPSATSHQPSSVTTDSSIVSDWS